MSDALGFGTALLLGLLASGHCLAMCGGISGALAYAVPRDARGRAPLPLLLGFQFGRVGSYALIGVLFGGLGAGLIRLLDLDAVRLGLRALTAFTLLLIAASLLGWLRDPSFGLGTRVWRRLSPLARRLLPVRHAGQALALGALWGWMPCGLVYSVLLLAWLSMDPWRSGALMAAFGLGTVPALLAGAWGAARLANWGGHLPLRRAAGYALIGFAALTLAGPWLASVLGWPLLAWLPFDCHPTPR